MDFYKRVAAVCDTIPYGRVATYGQIALLCGKPGNARQVGFALNKRIKDEEVPAYRVVNGQGILTGAAAFDGPCSQKWLLREEGVEVSSENKVNLKKFGWQNSLEEALTLREFFEVNNI
jgi:methylated-DNA-protein-cysteine methyltransferase-like protein